MRYNEKTQDIMEHESRSVSNKMNNYRPLMGHQKTGVELDVREFVYVQLTPGKSELAEIASIRASEKKITIVGTVDKKSKQSFFLGFPMWESIDDADEFDACIITSLEDPFEIYTETTNNYQSEKILVPSILGIKKS